MNIAFAGTPNSAKIILNGLFENNIIPKFVLTKPNTKKRSKEIKSPVYEFAEQKALPIFTSLKELDFQKALKTIDLCIVVAYGEILTDEILNVSKYGFINVHYSKLPDLRGSAPVQRAILRGDAKFYGTIFKIDKGVDTGEIYKTFELEKNSNTKTANQIIDELSHQAVAPLISIIKNIKKISTFKQSGDITYAPKINKSELEIDNNLSPEENYKKIRVGGAYFFYNNKRIEIIAAKINQGIGKEFIVPLINNNNEVGQIELLKVKPEGKNIMNAKDWTRGLR